MFVQVIHAKTPEPEAVKRRLDRWLEELRPGADGWLGATAGTTSDGHFVAIIRFDSEDAARRNSDRPEQGEWWSETEKHFDGEATFHDCREVDLILGGGSNSAGFVQVIEGRAKDPAALRGQAQNIENSVRQSRPDVLGGLVAYHGDGGFTQVVYFTSEEEARAGEARMGEDTEAAAAMQEFRSQLEGDVTFYDLTDPQLVGD